MQALGRRDAVSVFVLSVIGVGTPLWLVATAGGVGFPSNDDWTYMRGAESLFRTGTITMPGHTAAAIGQLVLAQPFLWLSGGDPWAFTAFGLALTAIGLVATYLLARRYLAMPASVLVVLLIEAFPGFARESATFMTDGPAFACAMLSLLLGTVWLQGRRTRALFAALAFGLIAASIREFAVAAPVAVLAAGWARSRPAERAFLAVASVVSAAALTAIVAAASSIANRGFATTGAGIFPLLVIAPVFTTCAAGLLPAIALGPASRLRGLTSRQLISAAAVVIIVGLAFTGPLVGNLWMASGALSAGMLSGTRDAVIGAPVWLLSEHLATFAGVVLAAIVLSWIARTCAGVSSAASAIDRAREVGAREDGVLVVFLVAYAGEVLVFAALGGGTLDRYLYPVIPIGAILLLRGAEHARQLGRVDALAHAALAWLAVSAFAIAANSFAYDAARFRAGDLAVSMGYDARVVDAGYDWVGYHVDISSQTRSVPHVGTTFVVPWYYDLLRPAPPCAILSNSPQDDPALTLLKVDRSAYREYLIVGPEKPLYLYAVAATGCPAPTAAIGAAAP